MSGLSVLAEPFLTFAFRFPNTYLTVREKEAWNVRLHDLDEKEGPNLDDECRYQTGMKESASIMTVSFRLRNCL